MNRTRLKPKNIERVIVRGTNWVGDAIMTIPALREIRRILPNAKITLATRSWSQGIFAGADFVDEIMSVDTPGNRAVSLWRQVTEWRSKRFELAILFQNAFQAALIARLAGVPHRIGYATDGRGFLLTSPLTIPIWRKNRHEVFYYLNIAAELEQKLSGTTSVPDRQPSISLDLAKDRLETARQTLLKEGAAPGVPNIALVPGSTNSRAKRWPAVRYAKLGDLLSQRLGANILLIGAPDELDVSQEVAALMTEPSVMLTGKTSLADAVAVLGVSDAVVTNDTGPAHIAAALDRPTVVIFGPTDPATTRPFSDRAVVVRVPPDCAPCMLRDCPIDHRCMTAIDPVAIFEKVLEIMNRK
ncbi:MAG: heptosyltransferase [Blastocatellia bacterium]|nr:heptosyltransferase [Blastocatellia bacterium]